MGRVVFGCRCEPCYGAGIEVAVRGEAARVRNADWLAPAGMESEGLKPRGY